MSTANDFIKIARTWIGVPTKPSGSYRNGTNCTGLVVGVLRDLGIEALVKELEIYTNFASPPESGLMLKIFKAHLQTIPVTEILPGDIVVFKIWREPQHIAIVTEPEIILHSDSELGKVVEHKLPNTWRPIAAFRVKELDQNDG